MLERRKKKKFKILYFYEVFSMDKFTPFKKQLTTLINKHRKESGSDTPDFILAKYLISCLKAFEIACIERDDFYEKG